ncbi:MAG: hypothetical protein AB200_01160 [Parcubacteria bacterium C7867-005]|nr:MAG: hypothetical protein AB200_01160 [Parcubacteria bacterium C7867-005]
MNINLKATGIELTDAIREYAQKKIGTLEKFLGKGKEGAIFNVEVGKTTKHHKNGDFFRAEVKISGAGFDNYAVSEAEDLYSAIDLVESELARELISEKGRKISLMRRGQRAVKNMMRGLGSRLSGFRRKP